MKIVRFFILLVTLLCGVTAMAEKKNSFFGEKSESPYYLFKMDNAILDSLWKEKGNSWDSWKEMPAYCDQKHLIATFPSEMSMKVVVDSAKSMPTGTYVLLRMEEKLLYPYVFQVSHLLVDVADDQENMSIKVFDQTGRVVSDAVLYADGKKMKYDVRSQRYLAPVRRTESLLKVVRGEAVCYYDIKFNLASLPKRSFKKPFVALARVVKDPVVSIREEEPCGYIAKFAKFGEKLADRINKDRGENDDYEEFLEYYDYKSGKYYDLDELERVDYRRAKKIKYRNERQDLRHGRLELDDVDDHFEASWVRGVGGSIVLNKPKYRPGDTLRVKAYLNQHSSQRLRKYRKEVTVGIGSGYKKIEKECVMKVSPKDGVYAFDLPFDDSLALKLDTRYNLYLFDSEGYCLARKDFRYEDYKLSSCLLSAQCDNSNLRRGDTLRVKVKAHDENSLAISGTRARFKLMLKKIDATYADTVSYPSVLNEQQLPLNAMGEATFVVPSDLFGKSDLTLGVEVQVETPDHEIMKKNISWISYQYMTPLGLNIKRADDSLLISVERNGVDTVLSAQVWAEDGLGNISSLGETRVPGSLKIDPIYKTYIVENEELGLREKYEMNTSAPLSAYWTQEEDRLIPSVENKLHLTFDYQIYENDKLVTKGVSSDTIPGQFLRKKENSYELLVHYLWGGRVRMQRTAVASAPNNLNVAVKQPSVIAPGSRQEVEVHVSDGDGKPVKNVDLTAYAITRKFNERANDWNEVGSLNRESVYWDDGIDLSARFFSIFSLYQSPYLCEMPKRDSLPYYSFLYPKDQIGRYEVDDSLTQFAPFVFNDCGMQKRVYILYLDEEPIYFSWCKGVNYSFRAEPGYHRLRIRLLEREMTVDSVYIAPGKRTLISLYDQTENPHVTIRNVSEMLSPTEQEMAKRYSMAYYDVNNSRYIISGDLYQMAQNRVATFFGPVKDTIRWVGQDFEVKFVNEPGCLYAYDAVGDSLVKSPLDDAVPFPTKLVSYGNSQGWDQRVQDVSQLLELNSIAPLYKVKYFPFRSQTGNRILELRTKKNIMGVFVTRPGYSSQLMVTNVDNQADSSFFKYDFAKGTYDLFVLYDDTTGFMKRGISMEEDFSYIKMQDKGDQRPLPRGVAKRLSKAMWVSESSQEERRRNMILNILSFVDRKPIVIPSMDSVAKPAVTKRGHDFTVKGVVSDMLGELPGADIVVRNSSESVVSDENGMFEIGVQEGDVLEISFAGYKTKTVKCQSSMAPLSLILEEESDDDLVMEVQAGYGVMKKSDLTGAVSSVSSSALLGAKNVTIDNALSGRVAGVQVSSISGQPGASSTVTIRGVSSLSGSSAPLYVVDGVPCTDISSLDLSSVADIKVLKDQSAIAIYGSRGANGVVVITTNCLNLLDESGIPKDNIRSNFSDYAFWQPRLKTDRKGIARFTTTFPDDITQWQTVYLASSVKNRYSKHYLLGSKEESIKSFLPISVKLSLPNFLVKGDSCYLSAKVNNYTSDTLSIHGGFEVNGRSYGEHDARCAAWLVDTLLVTPTEDTLTVTYQQRMDNHFRDGERRQVPINRPGVEQTVGQFFHLTSDHPRTLSFGPESDSARVYIMNSPISVFEEELTRLNDYKYYCNEQTTSKLIAWIASKRLAESKGENLKRYDKEKNRLLDILKSRQNKDGTWGWWEGSGTSSWISAYVIASLKQFGLLMNEETIKKTYTDKFFFTKGFSERASALKVLRLLQADVDVDKYFKETVALADTSANNRLRVEELKSLCGKPVDWNYLNRFRETTMMGNLYYHLPPQRSWRALSEDIENTLIVYQLMKNDSLSHADDLMKMRGYLFEVKQKGLQGRWWHNTYESAMIIRTIMDDVIQKEEKPQSSVRLSGATERTVDHFPCEIQVPTHRDLTFTTENSMPLYVSVSQRYWDSLPTEKSDYFGISTHLSDSVMTIGKEVTMEVSLTVKQSSDYVMVNVPIPAGCDYAEKYQFWGPETHREYFKDHVTIFCTRLSPGVYRFKIALMPKFAGVYQLNPAQVELMYAPELNAHGVIKRVEVR